MKAKGNRRLDPRMITRFGLGLMGVAFLVVIVNVIWPQGSSGPVSGLWVVLRVGMALVLIVAWALLNIPPPQLPRGDFILALAELGEEQRAPDGAPRIVPARRTLWDDVRATMPANVPLPEALPDFNALLHRVQVALRLIPESATTSTSRPPLRSLAAAAARAAGERPALPTADGTAVALEADDWVQPAPPPAPMPADPVGATNWLLRRLTERWNEDGGGDGAGGRGPQRTAADFDFAPDAATARAKGAEVQADLMVWGAMQTAPPPAFTARVEILHDLERRAAPGDIELRPLGLQSFPLGPLAPNRPELLFAVLTGLAYYAAHDWRTTLNEWNTALIAARVDRDMQPPLNPHAEAVVHFYRGNTFFLEGAALPADKRRETLQAAETAYLDAIKVDRRLTEAHHNLGLVYQAQGRLDKAGPAIAYALQLARTRDRPRYEQAMQLTGLGPIDDGPAIDEVAQLARMLDRARYNQAVLLINLGQIDKATRLLEKLRARRADPEIQRALGRVYRLSGRFDDAESAFRAAVRLDPAYAAAYSDLAALYYDRARPAQEAQRPLVAELNYLQQNLQEAQFAGQAAAFQPQIAALETRIGPLWREQQGWLSQARAQIQQTLALRPTDAYAHYNLGVILNDSGEPTAAADSFTTAERFRPTTAADFGLHFDRAGHVARDGGFVEATMLRPARADTFIKVGLELQREGRIAEATDQFIRVLYLDPSNPDANYRLGMVYMNQGETDAAALHLNNALNSSHPPPWPPSDAVDALATIYRNRQQYDRALTLLQAQLERDPHDARAFYNLGTIYRRQNQLEEAIGAFRAAIQYDPELADAHYNLGVAYIASGHVEEARAAFRRYAELNPQDPNTHVLVGVTLKDAREYEAARTELEHAVRLNPDHIEAHYNLGLVYQALNRPDAAIFEFRDVLRLDAANTRALTRLGIAYADAKKLDDALAIFTRLVTDDANNAEAHYNLGIIYQARGDIQGVIREFREVVRLRPSDADACNTLGMAYRTADQIEAAEAAFRSAIALQPELAEAHYNLARILTSTNRTPAAIEEFRIYEDIKDRERLAALRQDRALAVRDGE